MQHPDICTYLENIPNLAPHTNFGDSETYAQKAIKHVIIMELWERLKRKANAKISTLRHTMAMKI